MSKNYSNERVSSIIQREIVGIINEVIVDPKIGYINITEVRLTRDKSIATVYYTILSDDENIIKITKQAFDKNNGKIRTLLAEKIHTLRRAPELIFKYDTSLAYGNRIEKLLTQIK